MSKGQNRRQKDIARVLRQQHKSLPSRLKARSSDKRENRPR